MPAGYPFPWGSVLCGLSPLVFLSPLLLEALWKRRPKRSSRISQGPKESKEIDFMPRRPLAQASLSGLYEMFSDADELVRAAVCAEVGHRGHEARRAVPALVRAAVYDPSGVVRGSASAALSALVVSGEGLAESVLLGLETAKRDAQYPEAAFLAHTSELVELAIASRA